MLDVKAVAKFIVTFVITFAVLIFNITKKKGYFDDDDFGCSVVIALFTTAFIYLAFWAFS